MDEEILHCTTKHPIYGLKGKGINESLTAILANYPNISKEVDIRSNISTIFSMPKTDYGRIYKVNVEHSAKNDVVGYLQDQSLGEIRASHIMKNYDIYFPQGNAKEVENFYMDLQRYRRKINDRKPFLVQPMMYALTKKTYDFESIKGKWFKELDSVYRDTRSWSKRNDLKNKRN